MRQMVSIPIVAASAVTVLSAAMLLSSPARAQDFFSALFGGFDGPPRMSIPFGDPGAPPPVRRAPRTASSGGGTAYCVRTCDGRYFPVPSSKGHSRAETCSSFCPASETDVYYGSSIDRAANKNGKSYAQLPNAFRYRKELIAGCTCNGKDPGGLAHIDIEDDPTLRKGDLVATEDGSLVTSRAGASVEQRAQPSRSARASFGRIPMVAAE